MTGLRKIMADFFFASGVMWAAVIVFAVFKGADTVDPRVIYVPTLIFTAGRAFFSVFRSGDGGMP